MKYTLMLMMAAFWLVGCESSKSSFKTRPGAVEEVAKNMGNAEAERFLLEDRDFQDRQIERCRKQVANATTPQELALAQDSLSEARRALAKTEKELEEVR